MIISGIQKLTLLDFPGYTACTLFTAGCNFRCPFCHNASLVLGGAVGQIDQSQIIEFLKSRTGKLDGVCISGGEPLLQKGLKDFCKTLKDMGFLVKLDTNGSNCAGLKELIDLKLIDYVAMDIKNSPEKYALSAGVDVDMRQIKGSVELLLSGIIDYEFRTTVVNPYNTESDFEKIAAWIKGARAYYLQQFVHSDNLLGQNVSAYSPSQMERFLHIVQSGGVATASLRGI